VEAFPGKPMRIATFALIAWASLASARDARARPSDDANADARARLERVRSDPALSNDPAEIDKLARDLESFPAGEARVEARMIVAQAWLGRMGRESDAVAALRRVVDDPAAPPVTARLAEREIVGALLARGDVVEAESEARAHADVLDGAFVASVERVARRRWEQRAAVGVIASFVVFVSWALVRATVSRSFGAAPRALRSLATVAAPFLALLAGAGALLGWFYQSASPAPFLLFGPAALVVVLAARAWSAVGSNRRVHRLGRGLLCAATVLATAFTLLDALDPTYLEGFGL
jgi:hypothetical protein